MTCIIILYVNVFTMKYLTTYLLLFYLFIDLRSRTSSFNPNIYITYTILYYISLCYNIGIPGKYADQQYMFWIGPMMGAALAALLYGTAPYHIISCYRSISTLFNSIRIWNDSLYIKYTLIWSNYDAFSWYTRIYR